MYLVHHSYGCRGHSATGYPADHMTETTLPPAIKIDVTDVAQPYRDEVKKTIQTVYGGVGPKLVAFLANSVSPYDP